MNLTIAVDELDVVEVEVGQKVKITVDALSDAEMDGEVYKIAPVGSNSGGVTTYDVELTFDAEGSGVRSGMNATGEITVASTDSTLYVPVEALMTIGNDTYLMVENAGEMARTMAADSMPDLSNMPQGGSKSDFAGSFGERSGDASSGETLDAQNRGNRGNAPQRTQNAEAATEESGLIPAVKKLYSGVMDWLYADVNEETQVSGSLVMVTIGHAERRLCRNSLRRIGGRCRAVHGKQLFLFVEHDDEHDDDGRRKPQWRRKQRRQYGRRLRRLLRRDRDD